MNTENLKKMIILKFGSLQKCAETLGISPSTLTRNLSNPSQRFIGKLKSVGVPVDNSSIQESITAVISADGVEGFMVKENNEKYAALIDEIIKLKAENYDLKKQIEKLKH